jgi:hypothetical protein
MDDATLLGRLPLTTGRFFSSPAAREILLPARAAEALRIRAGDVGHATLRWRDTDWTVVGVLDDERFRLLRDLDADFPLIPFRRQTGTGAAPPPTTPGAQDIVLRDLGTLTIDTAALLVVSAENARACGGLPLSVSVRLTGPDGDDPAATALAGAVEDMLGVTRAKFHVGSTQPFRPTEAARRDLRGGIYYIGGGYRTAIGGLSRLVIPLLIAGTILLNTMLGTVYERKAEIAVYNAVGLNPSHIFLFFLSEAFVYGILGSVGGYLTGQLLAMGVQALGLVQGVSVNFSSMMVAYAILFSIGLVLLSTLYPARVATRTAVPSGKLHWELPPHDGRTMNLSLPFIYRPALAGGVMDYLDGYFRECTEQAFGDLLISQRGATRETDAAGRETLRLRYTMALAPFDLGVTQDVEFTARFDPLVRSYRIALQIARRTGQDTHWATINRPFLERLRKLLMRWRSMDATQHGWHAARGRELFEGRAE